MDTTLLTDINFFQFVIIIFTYNFIGWFYESTLYSIIEQKRFMNRGYFLGPYCPIYGVICVAGVYFLQDIESYVKVMIMGALLVTAIEYITSYVLEKLFDARYWDYSAYPLNINGRVSVISSIFFGFAVMFGVKILHPIMEELVVKIPDDICAITAISVLTIFITDAIFTSISMANLNKKFKAIYDYIDEYVDEKFETITDRSKFLDENLIIEKKKNLSVALHKISDFRNNVKHGMSVSAVANVRQNVKDTVLPNIKGLRERSSEVGISRIFKDNELHFLRAFPYFKSTKYNDLVERIKVIQRSKHKDK